MCLLALAAHGIKVVASISFSQDFGSSLMLRSIQP